MSSMWEILGLDAPSNDLKVIKRAYAKKLRVTRPDEDPAGFMALREALEHAKNYAQYQQHETEYDWEVIEDDEAENTLNTSDIPDVPETPQVFASKTNKDHEVVMDEAVVDAEIAAPEPHASAADQSESTPLVSTEKTAMEKVKDLFKNPFGRADTARWIAIFEDPILEGIDEHIDFEDSFRNFLLSELGYYDGEPKQNNLNQNPKLISTQVGTLIFNQMGWRDTRGRPLYIQDQIEWLRQDLDVINRSKRSASETSTTAYEQEKHTDKSSAWTVLLVIFGAIAIARIINQFI